MSYEDKQFLDLVSCKVPLDASGRYVLPLLTRDVSKLFLNGLEVCKRFNSLCTRLRRNTEVLKKYKRFMADMLDNKYAEPVREEEVSTNSPIWYIPHFDAHNKNKIRVVYDCSALF